MCDSVLSRITSNRGYILVETYKNKNKKESFSVKLDEIGLNICIQYDYYLRISHITVTSINANRI